MKRCTGCGEDKKLSCFGNNKRTKDGLEYRCRSCRSAYQKRYQRTEGRKKALRKYTNSEKGKRARAAYQRSEKAKEYQKNYVRDPEARTETLTKYNSSDKNKKNQSRYRRRNKKELSEKMIWYRRLRKYGLSEEQLVELLKSQHGKCGCCGTGISFHEEPKACVDHCHKTGKVRGILCRRCNIALGMLGDDLDGILKAVAYLTKAEAFGS